MASVAMVNPALRAKPLPKRRAEPLTPGRAVLSDAATGSSTMSPYRMTPSQSCRLSASTSEMTAEALSAVSATSRVVRYLSKAVSPATALTSEKSPKRLPVGPPQWDSVSTQALDIVFGTPRSQPLATEGVRTLVTLQPSQSGETENNGRQRQHSKESSGVEVQGLMEHAWDGAEDLAKEDMEEWLQEFEQGGGGASSSTSTPEEPRKSLQDVKIGNLLDACYEDEKRKVAKEADMLRCSLRSVSTMASLADADGVVRGSCEAMSTPTSVCGKDTPNSSSILRGSLGSFSDAFSAGASAALAVWSGSGSGSGKNSLLPVVDIDLGGGERDNLDASKENRSAVPVDRGVRRLLSVIEPLSEEPEDEDAHAFGEEDDWEEEFMRRCAADECRV